METQLTDPTPGPVAADGARGELVRFRNGSELVALTELLYRGIFGGGFIVAAIVTAYALLLGLLQPTGSRLVATVACAMLLACQLLVLRFRAQTYALLRRWALLIVLPALLVGGSAAISGSNNEQFYYVLVMAIGVGGIAVTLRATIAAALVAAGLMTLPYLIDGDGLQGVAVAAAIAPPVFWLLVEQLAVFMLSLQQVVAETPSPPPVVVHADADRDAAQAEPRRQITTRASSLGIAGQPRHRARRWSRGTASRLTARQQEAVFYCCDGLKDAEIAEALSIGVAQVQRYLAQARKRTGTKTREQLAAWAVTSGLLP